MMRFHLPSSSRRRSGPLVQDSSFPLKRELDRRQRRLINQNRVFAGVQHSISFLVDPRKVSKIPIQAGLGLLSSFDIVQPGVGDKGLYGIRFGTSLAGEESQGNVIRGAFSGIGDAKMEGGEWACGFVGVAAFAKKLINSKGFWEGVESGFESRIVEAESERFYSV